MCEHDRPNILLVHADQHRYDCVGANGHSLVETPAIDRLTNQGTNFEHAYTPIPICSPERASLMTGQWPNGHGTYSHVGAPGGSPLTTEAPTFAEVAQNAGYATSYVGRWDLGHEERGGPEAFGFDAWIPNSRYAEWREAHGLPERPGSENGWFGQPDTAITVEQSRLAWAARQTLEQLEELAGSETPFLLRWDTFEPHLPNVVPEPFASMYDPEVLDPWGSFDDPLTDKPYAQRQVRRNWRIEGLEWEEWAPTVARYLGEISLLDQQLGRVLDRLDELGIADETIVVYTADHGDMCGSHGMIDKHFNMYDDVMRVPLLARGPGIPVGETRDDFVSHALDVAATICASTSGSVPDSFDGEPLFDSETDEREEIFATYYGCQQGLYHSRMLRDHEWKYVWNPTAIDELYNLREDPWERTNLAVDPGATEPILEDMRRRMLAWIQTTGDDLNNPWAAGQLAEDAWVWDGPGGGQRS